MPVWFTPASARRALGRVRPAAERMCRIYRRLEREAPGTVRTDSPVDPIYFTLILELEASMNEIDRSGAVVVDPRRGVVDFPSRRDGRLVMLCWEVGESRLRFWHEPGDGAARRRPVDDDGPWDAC